MNKITKRRTLIEIETHEITVIRTDEKRPIVFCGNCGVEVGAVANEQQVSFRGLLLNGGSHAAAAEDSIEMPEKYTAKKTAI
jgi:hypothetical protein